MMMPDDATLSAQLLQTWRIHNRIQLFHLASIPEDSLALAASARTRKVGRHFAHMHNVRLMWLKAASADLLHGLEKVEDDLPTGEILRHALEGSGAAIATLLQRGLAEGRIRSFKPNAVAFLGYLIAHDAYHMGKIDFILRETGHAIDDQTHIRLWEWGKHSNGDTQG